MRQSLSNRRVNDALSIHRYGWTRKLKCDASLPADLVESLWDDPDQRLLPLATMLQEKDRCAVLRVDHPQQSFLLKRHIWGPISRSIRMLLRKPTATRSAAVSALLFEKGIPTPKVRACVVDGVGPLSYRSYLVTDFIEGTTLFHAIRSGQIPTENLQGVARKVAAIWQNLIELNVSHNDLKPENFMVDKSLDVWLIDFEKTKMHREQTKLRRRHLDDVERFLHVRSWREGVGEAEVFRQELLQTSLRSWALQDNKADHPLLREGYTEAERFNKISVVIPVLRNEADPQLLKSTIDSVRDVADEILLVDPETIGDQFQVWHTIATYSDSSNSQFDFINLPANTETKQPKHPWILVLLPGELATPDLVRQLPEWIIDARDCDAMSLPIESLSLQRTLRWRNPSLPTSARVFRKGHSQFTLVQGKPTVVAKEGRMATKCVGILTNAASESALTSNYALRHSKAA